MVKRAVEEGRYSWAVELCKASTAACGMLAGALVGGIPKPNTERSQRMWFTRELFQGALEADHQRRLKKHPVIFSTFGHARKGAPSHSSLASVRPLGCFASPPALRPLWPHARASTQTSSCTPT